MEIAQKMKNLLRKLFIDLKTTFTTFRVYFLVLNAWSYYLQVLKWKSSMVTW